MASFPCRSGQGRAGELNPARASRLTHGMNATAGMWWSRPGIVLGRSLPIPRGAFVSRRIPWLPL